MVPISNLFIDLNEQIIEDLTVCCFDKYGESFLESLEPFFESGDTTQIDIYFNRELNTLFEAVGDDLNNKEKVEAGWELKDAMKDGAKQIGKRTPGRNITHALSKSKIGRAIVKGLRRVAYGTRTGRKFVRRHAARLERRSKENIKGGKKTLKNTLKSKAEEKKADRNISEPGNIGKSWGMGFAAQLGGMTAGLQGQRAKTQARMAHQLRRNANWAEKKQKVKKEAKARSANTPKFAHA